MKTRFVPPYLCNHVFVRAKLSKTIDGFFFSTEQPNLLLLFQSKLNVVYTMNFDETMQHTINWVLCQTSRLCMESCRNLRVVLLANIRQEITLKKIELKGQTKFTAFFCLYHCMISILKPAGVHIIATTAAMAFAPYFTHVTKGPNLKLSITLYYSRQSNFYILISFPVFPGPLTSKQVK